MGSTIAHRTRTMTFSFGAIRIPVANVRRHRAIYTNTRHTLTHTRQLQVFCMPFDSDTFTFIKNATSDFQGDRFRQNYGFTLPCAIPLQTIYSVVCQMLVCCCFDWVVGRLAEWFQVDFWLKFVVNSYFVCDVWNMLRARNVTQWRARTHTHTKPSHILKSATFYAPPFWVVCLSSVEPLTLSQIVAIVIFSLYIIWI